MGTAEIGFSFFVEIWNCFNVFLCENKFEFLREIDKNLVKQEALTIYISFEDFSNIIYLFCDSQGDNYLMDKRHYSATTFCAIILNLL